MNEKVEISEAESRKLNTAKTCLIDCLQPLKKAAESMKELSMMHGWEMTDYFEVYEASATIGSVLAALLKDETNYVIKPHEVLR